jgi:hypothetical protein
VTECPVEAIYPDDLLERVDVAPWVAVNAAIARGPEAVRAELARLG